MSLVRKNNRSSGVTTLAQVLSSVLNPGAIDSYRSAWEAGRKIGAVVSKSDGNIAAIQPDQNGSYSRPSGNPRRNGRRRRGREKKNNPQNADSFRTIGMGPTAGAQSLRTRLTGIVTCTTQNTAGTVYMYMIGNLGGSALFAQMSSDGRKLASAFEKATIHRVSARFVGTIASTTPGYVTLAYDSSTDPSVAVGSTVQSVTDTHTNVIVADVKGECSLTYVPKGTDKEIQLQNTTANNSEMFAGKLTFLMGGSGLAVGTTFGLLHVSVDVTFHQ